MQTKPDSQFVNGLFGLIKKQSAGKLVSVSGIGKHGATSGGLVINQTINGGNEMMSLKTAIAEKRQQVTSLVNEVEAIQAKCDKENRAETSAEKARLEAITCNGGLLDQLAEQVIAMETKHRIMDRAALIGGARIDAQNAESEGRSIVTSNQSKTTIFTSKQDAYNAGMFYASALFGSCKAQNYCENHGLISNAMTGGNDLTGGAVVPELQLLQQHRYAVK